MKLLAILLMTMGLAACGKTDEKQTFVINGEELQCTVIDQTECGLTLACDDQGIFECFNN